ncbi:SusC/RagA family TonB-linked outer membrane protein [Labilibaculum euxinus]|uniref:SusC/RagA family TonB-linked outer membrane protein n=1 Tax=Labilibaculum euxinus TaxID=2686357 RepID=A0A7M4D1Z0_9BACT|nr:TonB-dependent receptor [Labilibaculum euxinus]MUP36669.1 SusC/RagA family TonB-linked outer membrane protein [Labilibaculum euxinus]MVB05874.1 SusC/RagA family TonB-linked outer membrane protein [Labilibaculum euxinus]
MKKHTNKTRIVKRWLVLIIILYGFSFNAISQITVSGNVTDGVTTIPGVTIIEEGTSNGTLSDIDGNYSITVAGKDSKITFSFVGLITQTIVVNDATTINIQLKEEISELDEVVVIGYGTARKKDLTGAVSSVGGKELVQVPVTTAAQAITGKIAGVSVITQSGAPGADINIVVRGGTSITQGSSPLYIVDGFQMDDGLKNIDINDIESIDVMKDASATAIYGARGSNGVVIITTKSGKKGKTEVNYNAYVSFEKLGSELNLLNTQEYVEYQYEFQTLNGQISNWANVYGGDITNSNFYTGAYDRIQSQYGSVPGINWQDVVFGGTAKMTNHNLNITGSGEKTQYMLSYNYTGQDGLVDKSGYTRNGIRAKINHELRKGINLTFSSSFLGTKLEGGGSLGGLLKMSILQPITGGVLYTDDQLINTDISDEMQDIDSQYDIYNPLITNDAVTKTKYTRLYTTNASLDIDINKNIKFRTAGSYLWQQVRSESWDDGRTKTAQNNKGPYGNRDNSEKYSWQVTNTLTWKGETGAHKFNVLLGQETYYSESMNLKNTYYEFPENNFGLNDVSMAGQVYSYSSGKSTNGIVSAFSRLNYNFDERYLVTATIRGDGSSKFSKGKQWGYFPSVSAAWRVSEESFMSNMDVLNNLKLRIGYGTTGNCNISNNMYATDYQSGFYAVDNRQVVSLKPGNTVGNPNLKWETTRSTNIGLDVSFFNSRVNLTAEFYNNKSNDLLIKNKIPTSTGYSYQYQNIGSIRNRGYEFVLNTTNIKNDNFKWTTDFNISFNKSKVLAIYGDDKDDYFKQNYDSRIDFLIEVGKPLGQFYGYQYDGIYITDDFSQNSDGSYSLNDGVPSLKGKIRSSIKPGDVKYKTTEGNTDDDGNPVWSTDDRKVIGNAEPIFTGGIVNTFKYKGFDFSAFMSFSYGNDVFNMNSQRFIGPYLPNQNSLSVMADRFVLVDPTTGEETTNLQQLAGLNPQQHNSDAMWSLNSSNKIAITDALDYYIEDGSFLRINNITLGYTLPAKILKRMKVNSLRFYCTLNNIHTFTKYSGYDPEVSATSNLLTRGIDNSAYPRAKSCVLGLNLTF